MLTKTEFPKPTFGTTTLEGCEKQYRAYDILHQLSRRMGWEDDCTEAKADLCVKINALLAADKDAYIRKCTECGKTLPLLYPFSICAKCHDAMTYYGWNPRK